MPEQQIFGPCDAARALYGMSVICFFVGSLYEHAYHAWISSFGDAAAAINSWFGAAGGGCPLERMCACGAGRTHSKHFVAHWPLFACVVVMRCGRTGGLDIFAACNARNAVGTAQLATNVSAAFLTM